MKKAMTLLCCRVALLALCTVLVIGALPHSGAVVDKAGSALALLSSPDSLPGGAQTIFSSYIPQPVGNTDTIPSETPQPVMRQIGSKDSNDDWDITETPSDVLSLMEAARQTEHEADYIAKTSEEPYLGGGTLLSYNGVEIQSKIPEDFYKPDIAALLKDGADLQPVDKSQPAVLVYHSHTTEAYALLDTGFYISSDARSKDNARNVVRVGDELVRAMERHGYQVIHDTEIHDEDYNASYDSSRMSIEKYLEEYPSIDITIDLHRDDITYSDKTKVKPTAVINGKKAAKMMLIAGCEYGKVKNYPDWEYNLRFDLAVQQQVNAMYAGVMRPVLFSQRKYNMYETHNSFLLEVGTDANTLEEACYAARMFGDALGTLLDERYSTQ